MHLNCTDNGIRPKTFAVDITEDDISCPNLGFTFGGKKVLRRLHRVCIKP